MTMDHDADQNTQESRDDSTHTPNSSAHNTGMCYENRNVIGFVTNLRLIR